MVHRTNSDLANDYGNLAQRVLSMIAKNCGAKVPDPGPFAPADETMLAQPADALSGQIRPAMESQAFHESLDAIWAIVRAANKYVDDQAPWTLKKTDPPRMATVLYVLAETVRRIAILTQPFMPESSAKMLAQLGVPESARTLAHLDPQYRLVPGTDLPAPAGVFPRYVEEAHAN
jgi:methionyl-tRNA synthetase